MKLINTVFAADDELTIEEQLEIDGVLGDVNK